MKSLIGAAALLAATPAAAEVTASAPTSFAIEQVVSIDAPIEASWDTLRMPQTWWDPEHTYSGDSANLYMDAQATGCFCEHMKEKGSVEHGHIVYVAPGRMIRLTGALGPLQAEAVTATLTFKLDPTTSGKTRLTLTYVVGGYMRQGGETLAPLVDKVLTTQVERLKAAAEKSAAPAAATAPPKKKAKSNANMTHLSCRRHPHVG